MKIKTIIRIFVFMTMPFVNADPADDCKAFLRGKHSASITNRVMELFSYYFGKSEEELQNFKNEGAEGEMIAWILGYKRGQSAASHSPAAVSASNSHPATPVAPAPQPTPEPGSASARVVINLPALKTQLQDHNQTTYEGGLDISSILKQETPEGFYQALGSFIQKWNFYSDETLVKIWTNSDPNLAPSSSAPSPVEAPTQPSNPYLGKTVEALFAMSDADSSLNANPLFTEALNRVLGGEVIPSDIGSLSETFPLMSVIQRTCNFEELKSFLTALSLDYSSQDRYSIPALGDFLRTNGLTAITTPGFGNCAFDAVLLTWFCKAGLYDPRWNTTLGAYLESQIAGFRGEIANLLPEGKKLGEETRDTIKTKDKYVSDAVFTLIAQYLKTEIIAIAIDGTAQCCLLDTTVDCSLTPQETESLIKRHPDALIVCHNGTNHFLATRPLLPEEHQE